MDEGGIDDSPRASISRWNTINSEFKSCPKEIGIYGHRKNCLYAIIIMVSAMVILNSAILVWIIRVMDFTIDGMGRLRITRKGIRVEGEAEFMSSIIAENIQSNQEVPLAIKSSSNITLSVYNTNGELINSLFIGDSIIQANCDKFSIRDTMDNELFQVDEDTVSFDVDTLTLTNKGKENQGGISFDGSVQTNYIHSGLFNDLRMESPTREIKLEGTDGIYIETRSGSISASCLQDFDLSSQEGSISLDSVDINLKHLRISNPDDATKTYWVENNQETYQVCICENGRLFLASPTSSCQADDFVCK